MTDLRLLDIGKNLIGLPVLNTASGDRLGVATDVIIQPVEGSVLGIIIRTAEGNWRYLATSDFMIGKDAIMAGAHAHLQDQWTGGVPVTSEVVGTSVITETGKVLGRISEVYISIDRPIVCYRVAESTLQKFLGGGFYIPGDLPLAYSNDRVRMIVPPDTEEHYAFSSLNELAENARPITKNRSAAR